VLSGIRPAPQVSRAPLKLKLKPDYLIEEVMGRQSSTVQTFLLHTSILEQLSASLCDAVLKRTDSQKRLEFLERANVFVVPLDGQRRWYRYHALFAEALRSQHEQTEEKSVSTLHLRASRWYAEQGYLTEAARHAISARDWGRAADLIEREYTTIWANNEHALVRHWLEKLPVEVVRSRPRLCLAYAKTLFMVAPYATIERWLHDAERALRPTIPANMKSIVRKDERNVNVFFLLSTHDIVQLPSYTHVQHIISGFFVRTERIVFHVEHRK
jgi:LuxR family maltose regulon positive regulatory protein